MDRRYEQSVTRQRTKQKQSQQQAQVVAQSGVKENKDSSFCTRQEREQSVSYHILERYCSMGSTKNQIAVVAASTALTDVDNRSSSSNSNSPGCMTENKSRSIIAGRRKTYTRLKPSTLVFILLNLLFVSLARQVDARFTDNYYQAKRRLVQEKQQKRHQQIEQRLLQDEVESDDKYDVRQLQTQVPVFTPSIFGQQAAILEGLAFDSPSDAPSLSPSSVPSFDTVVITPQATQPTPPVVPVTPAPVQPLATPAPLTPAPTPAPLTPMPTPRPTRRPTRAPVALFTRSPTEEPTFYPTDQPTQSPTGLPTPSPTTAEPTTAAPTTETPKPTISPEPTGIPTSSPTLAPTGLPTIAPTSTPTTPVPTVTPTEAPTYPLQRDLVDVTMKLLYIPGRLQRSSAITWEEVTSRHIFRNIQRVDSTIVLRMVQANIVDQTVKPDTNDRRRRRLQEPIEPLQIDFDVQVDYSTPKDRIDIPALVGEAFNSEAERKAYIRALRQTADPTFTSLIGLELLVDGFIPIEEQIKNGGGNSGIGILPLALGTSIAGVLFLIGVAILIYRNRQGKAKQQTSGKTVKSSQPSNGQPNFSTEIVVETRPDDVSTLGDPVMGMMMNGERDEQTASIGNDYDYTKSYYQTGRERLASNDDSHPTRVSSATSGLSKTGLGPMGASVFSDDVSFEQQFNADGLPDKKGYAMHRFDVTVPPGKLGMVIDTPNGGVPVVHAIKTESVLADQVRVGDRLMFVDKEDVTAMTAVQVSKLISLKSDQTRLLSFVRAPASIG